MAGTVTVTRVPLTSPTGRRVEKIQVDWTADASAATIPDTTLSDLYGYLIKAITNPGSTAPTANYDIKLLDPDDSSIDALASTLIDRHTTNSEQVYPNASGATLPIFLAGDYTLNITGNAVNSATGQIFLYLIESL